MLLSAVSLACLLVAYVANGQDECTDLGTTPPSNTEGNYAIDLFTGYLLFTYAIDKCTAISIFPGNSFKYQCVSSNGKWSVTKKQFSNKDCSGSGTLVDTFNEGDAASGQLGYFVCDAKSSYVAVEVSLDNKCKNPQVIYAGLGGCTGNDPLLTRFYCDQGKALVEFFATLEVPATSTSVQNMTSMSSTESPTMAPADIMCYDFLYCTKWAFGTTCKGVAELMGQKIYGKMNSCMDMEDNGGGDQSSSTEVTMDMGTSDTDTNSNTDTEDSASSVFVISNLIFALVVSLFSLF